MCSTLWTAKDGAEDEGDAGRLGKHSLWAVRGKDRDKCNYFEYSFAHLYVPIPAKLCAMLYKDTEVQAINSSWECYGEVGVLVV